MKIREIKMPIMAFIVSTLALSAGAETHDVELRAGIETHTSKSDAYAPYYMSSNQHGTITQARDAQLRVGAFHSMDTTRRFSFGYGADITAGTASSTVYDYYDVSTQSLLQHKVSPSSIYIQQLYGELKYRCLFLTIGSKEQESRIVNHWLSSGDLTFSGNIRPIPEVRVGFIDFQDIPYTKGELQIEGIYSFGKYQDGGWVKKQFNYTGMENLCTGVLHSYKRIYFRTNPHRKLTATVGMQSSMQLGGTMYCYLRGEAVSSMKEHFTFAKLFKTLIPTAGDTPGNDVYKEGNSVGSWDVLLDYKLSTGNSVRAYYESPWEVAASIAKRNGFDGLYGVEYCSANRGILTGAVVEYFDFRNQCGPIHFAPTRYEGTTAVHIPDEATGRNDYYNNFQYSGYQYYGMSIGTPLLKSSLYNLNGSSKFLHNRVYGFHMAITGYLYRGLQYRAMLSARSSLGSYENPTTKRERSVSSLIECSYTIPRYQGIKTTIQLASDIGQLYGDNFGVLMGVSYTGDLKF